MGPLPGQIELITRCAEDTQTLGVAIGSRAESGDVFLLTGELGAGKTCLTQGIARGLGVADNAASPSFVIVREYRGRLPLFHIDLYRLEKTEEIADLGLEDYFYREGVSVVEWAERARGLVPENHLAITIRLAAEHQRHIVLRAGGSRYLSLLSALRKALRETIWNCPSTPQLK
ncbi:MAG: tRNA (adenosine(37)-N6)-threonylcarbamoyltransferase complex ATPase subunit type 1 TsaE [Chloroflexi bacterium]|nr:tRNA (adenosine(37)-N6)-threonylcarbamoyltransferase complex ATPase subunit type 1 TsaE [Chloroflexota bacterium]